ncbi:TPA: Gp15 family bacteriophage protein [Streptococcus suis]
MIDLSRGFRDELIIDDVVYPLDLSFGNVLRLLEMVHSDDVLVYLQPLLALRMLISDEQMALKLLEQIDLEIALKIFKEVVDEHIVIKQAKASIPVYDLAGNLVEKRIKQSSNDDEEEEDEEIPLFSLKYDGDYIYASFLQAYNIDLVEVCDSLHWQKFNALLNGLPNGTKFVEILKIRSWKEQESDSVEYRQSMYKLQEEYALPSYIEY